MKKKFKISLVAFAAGVFVAQANAGIEADGFTSAGSNGSVWIDSNNGKDVTVTSEAAINTFSALNTNIWVNNTDAASGTGSFQVVDRNGPDSAYIVPFQSYGQATTIGAFGTVGVGGDGTTQASVISTVVVNTNGVAINGPTNSITGANNSMTATGTNTITGATNNINGVTNINASNNAATNINTGTSTGNVTVGNAANTTNLNSLTNNIGLNSAAANTTWTAANTYSNNIGTGTGKTVNNIGNANAASQVNAQAGTAKMTLANNSAQLTVPSAATGVNNGVAVDNTKASLTGGDASPTRLTMTDNAATFSRVSNGAPITVTGVADGRADFDAVNVRQFAGAISAVAAQANVPALAAGQDKNFGVGLGSFMGKTGLALGMNIRGEDNTTFKLSLSTGLNGGAKTVIGAGAAWAF